MLLDIANDKDQLKNFLIHLAHSLRNPLSPLINASYMLQHSDNPQTAQTATGIIQRQIINLNNLVNTLLDICNLDQGSFSLKDCTTFDLNEKFGQWSERWKMIAASRNQSLDFTLPTEPVCVTGNPDRLQQALSTFVNTACKYSNEKKRIGVSMMSNEDIVAINIQDSGIGMSDDRLKNIFSDDMPQGYGDWDLCASLALAKTIIQLHHGHIETSSEMDDGTEFSVILPLSHTDISTRAPRRQIKVRPNSTILVVDDHFDQAETLRLIISKLGHTVYVAYNGRVALDLALTYQPDIAILDIGLPEESGHVLLKKLRGVLPNLQAIALSGYNQQTDIDLSLKSGFTMHLPKPLNPDRLVKMFKV